MKLWEPLPRQPFTGLVFCAIAGVVFADLFQAPLGPVFLAAAFSAILVISLPRTWSCWFFTGIAFFTLHTIRVHHNPALVLARHMEEVAHVAQASGVVWSEPILLPARSSG